MKFTVVYLNDSGKICQTHRGEKGLGALPDGRSKIEFDIKDNEVLPDCDAKKVDIATLALVDDEDILKERHNSGVISAIRNLEDSRFVRAVLDRDVYGDGGESLQRLAVDIGKLRAQLR